MLLIKIILFREKIIQYTKTEYLNFLKGKKTCHPKKRCHLDDGNTARAD